MDDLARRLARTVAANTGGKQRDTIDKAHLRVLVCGPGSRELPAERFQPALADALEAGWVEQTEDGRFRAAVGYHEL